MNNFIQLIILLRIAVIIYVLLHQKEQEREKHLHIFFTPAQVMVKLGS